MKNKWIKVEDKLPEPFVDVLVYYINKTGTIFDQDEKYYAIDRLCTWKDGEIGSFATDRFFGNVTHWMILPNPPGGKDE
jgi:hypothetical protein